jgi:NAD(P)-dependent dehydrogenase (short-subunit alcohol dehydrogenase family)
MGRDRSIFIMKLEGKVAIITGSTSGIGKAIAMAFSKEGANVVLNGARKRERPELVEECTQAGTQAIYVQADVSQSDQVQAMVKQAIDTFGRLDILVNNAAYGHGGGQVAHELPESDWDAVLGVCLKGAFLGAKYALPEMMKVGSGVIINIGSIEGVRGFASDTAYTTAKGGMNSLNQALAVDYASENIRANVIIPGFIATPLNEQVRKDPGWMQRVLDKPLIKRPGTSEEVAHLAVFLASENAAYITGASFTIDGGWTVR